MLLVEAAQLKVAAITKASAPSLLDGIEQRRKVRIPECRPDHACRDKVYVGDSGGFLVFGLMQRIRLICILVIRHIA
jgi:hypothetical protein